LGATGSTILGITLLLVGALLLSGASLGAILRHSGHRVRHAATRARRPRVEQETWDDPVVPVEKPKRSRKPVVDAEEAYGDVVLEEPVVAAPPILPSPLLEATVPEPLVAQKEQLFEDITREHSEYKLPDAAVLNVSPEKSGASEETGARVADLLVQT